MHFLDDSLLPENQEPLVIQAAPYGPQWLPGDSDDIPVSMADQVQKAVDCYNAGATVLHVHIREADGKGSKRLSMFNEMLDRLRTAVPKMVLQVGGSISFAPENEGDTAKWLSDDTRHGLAELTPRPDQVTVAVNTNQMNTAEMKTPSDVEGTSGIVQKGVPPQLASSPITARHVLTHTSGLPNLSGEELLQTYFPPGSWFSYSSVGFAYLQMALEAATNESLEALAQRLVFDPLGMQSSSFQWRDRFSEDVALPHEGEERLEKHRPAVAHASYSLQTTAGDYAKFMVAVLNGTSLRESTRRQWLTPTMRVPKGDATHLADSPPRPSKKSVGASGGELKQLAAHSSNGERWMASGPSQWEIQELSQQSSF
ncbi:Beta-lactamase [Variovorax sp. CF079]|uniref:3-keto-5-aminohexanoate cleavage protein n=1 Tax=Variovorax sp. CF079 TaxID=1882774 RepID=UPI00088D28C9|nr:3-keto-5-aminohexanoate cleavage protein [Variovorax sp. CF079]SDE88175.1 Beta-lactamase [Variovorax sp. CF079]